MLDTVFLVPLAAALVFLIVGNDGRRHAILLLPIISLACVWLISPAALISLMLLIMPFFFAREAIDQWRWQRNGTLLVVTFALLTFLILKNYFGFGGALLSIVAFEQSSLTLLLGAVGLSFVIFRVIEYCIVAKVSDPKVPMSTTFVGRFWLYLGFCLAFPTVTSGPILRWRGYWQDVAGEQPLFENNDDLTATLHRLANGILVIAVLSQPLFLFSVVANDFFSGAGVWSLTMQVFVALMAIFYLHFLRAFHAEEGRVWFFGTRLDQAHVQHVCRSL